MALTPRKKKGLASIIGGAVFIVTGVVLFQTEVTPEWLNTATALIGIVANFFGLGLTLPEES